MSFWNTSDGESVTKGVEKEYSSGGNFDPIPEKTNCLAFISNARWATKRDSDERYVEVEYTIEEPSEYSRRKVRHNLWVKDPNPDKKTKAEQDKKRDSDLKMLATIDAIAGGKLAKNGREPDDDDLALGLTSKAIMIKLMLTPPDKDGNRRNWVSHVAPKNGTLDVTKVEPAAASSRTADDDLEDSIPF